jgi:hypothetical protein
MQRELIEQTIKETRGEVASEAAFEKELAAKRAEALREGASRR